MIVKVLVENTEWGECKGEHGLSLLIEYNNKFYIVDTGASGLFAENAEKMKVDLSAIEAGFLSHAHYDHSGGYVELFEKNKNAKIYLQTAAKQRFFYKIAGPVKKYIGIPKGILERYNDRFEYVDGYKDFGNGIYILPHNANNSKIMERAKHTHMCEEVNGKILYDSFSHEQTVVFRENDGLVCFNSCSHSGVEVVIEEVKKAFPNDRIKAFFGGFHMMGITGASSCSYKKSEVLEVANELMESSEAVFYSGHCTGTIAFDYLKEVLGDRLQKLYSGKEMEV